MSNLTHSIQIKQFVLVSVHVALYLQPVSLRTNISSCVMHLNKDIYRSVKKVTRQGSLPFVLFINIIRFRNLKRMELVGHVRH
jgi:formate hydrogenlyase subunit 4